MYRMMRRLTWLTLVLLSLSASWGQEALGHQAHRGWGWVTNQEFALTGMITDVRLGNPHGEVTLDVDGKTWIVEIGQPQRHDRVGLSEERLRVGQIITVHGYRFAKVDKLLVRAKRVVINGKIYDLYPLSGPHPSPKWRTFWVSPFWPNRITPPQKPGDSSANSDF